jgi:hypothetical protein
MASQDPRTSLPADDEPVGSWVTAETMDEMTLLALQRAAATGKPVAVGCFTGASDATVMDLEPDEPEEPDEPVEEASPSRVARSFVVKLEHPSPSLGQTWSVLVPRSTDAPVARPCEARTRRLRPRERRDRRSSSRGGDSGDGDGLADESEPPPERGAA